MASSDISTCSGLPVAGRVALGFRKVKAEKAVRKKSFCFREMVE